MLFDFDSSPSRDNTHCYKHDSKAYNNIPLDAIPLWVADMDFESAPCIKETLIHRAAHGIYGYTFTPDAYYDAIINWMYTRHQWQIHREWIVPAPNLVTTFDLVCQGFLTPGDKVLVQNPVYHPFKGGPLLNDMEIAINSLRLVDGHYEIDFDDFEAKVKDPAIKLFILCNPHNPVGRVWTYDELKRMGELCVQHDVLIISDEIHQDIVYPGHQFTSMGTMPEHIANQVFVCTSPGKTFNMPILACGNIIIQNEGLRLRFEAMLKRIAFQDMNPFTIEATITAYTEGAPWVDALLDYLLTNITY
ncbi:MAG: MalY/PatB family protein, partial [Cellulosilyticaceae bacterium]